MVYSAGTAEVQILPTLRGFNATAATQINSALSGVGAQAGQKTGGELGQGLNTGLGSQLTRAGESLSGLGRSASSALLQAVPALGQFRDGFTGVITAATGLSGRMNTLGGLARTALQPAITGVQNVVAGFRDSDAAASAFTGRLGTIGGQFRTIASVGGSTISSISSSFASFSSNAASQVETKLSAAFDKVKDVGLTALGAIGVGSLAGLVSSGIQRISDIEQTTKALDVLTGSATKAQAEMNDLLTFAKTTPFAFPDIAQIGKNLIAFGVDTQQVVPALKALGDAASASGRGAAGLGELGDIMGSIAARGKISGDEIMRFSQAGVPALQILANTAHVSAAQMQKDISAGSVNSQFAINALITGIENGTSGLAGNTARFGGIMLQQKDTLVGALDSMHAAVTSSMATLLQPLVPAIRSAMGGIGDAFKALPQMLTEAKAAMDQIGLTSVFTSILGSVRSLVQVALPLLGAFAQGFLSAFGPGIVVVLRAVGDALGWVADHLKQWQPYITPLVTALGVLWGIQTAVRVATLAWGAAMLIGQGIVFGLSVVTTAWSVAMTVLRGVIMAVQAAQWLLNAAWEVSPIGVIVLAIATLAAGFVYLWTHSAGFRDFWIGLWHDIEAAAVAVWQNALKPAWDGLVTGLTAIGAAATWLWVNVLSPVFNAIGLAARILAAVIITILVTPYVIAFQALAAITMWLWNTAIGPFLSWVGAGFAAFGNWCVSIWTTYISPFLTWVGDGFVWLWDHSVGWLINMVVAGLLAFGNWCVSIWTTYIAPFLAWVGEGFVWLWNGFIAGTIGLIQSGLSKLGDFFDWCGGRISAAWGHVGDFLRWVYNNGIRPAFDAVTGALDDVGRAFESGVDWIGRVWGQVKGIAADPVNFVIDWVYNKGIRAVWNAVAGFLALAQLPPAGLVQFAEGGVVPGYEPGRDRHLIAVSGGEGVLVPEAVAGLGPAFVGWANAYYSGGRSRGGVGTPQQEGYADGGIVNSVLGFVGGLEQNAIELFRSPVDWIKAHIGFPDSGWINELAQMPAQIISKTVDIIWSKLTSFGSGGGAASGDLLGWIRAAILFAGVPADWAGPLQTLIMRESGGNPRAINLTDINAQRGDPSRGLMQTIGATFNAYRDPRLSPDIYDPVSNIVAGIRYILARYGSIFNVQQANAALPPKGYDTGGWLPVGYSTVYNGTGSSEAVLPRDDYDALINKARGGDGAATINVYARTDADPEHIAHTVDRHLALGMRL